MRANYDKSKARQRARRGNNVVQGYFRAVLLQCGHETQHGPLATSPTRSLYVCPEGCTGLQEPRRR